MEWASCIFSNLRSRVCKREANTWCLSATRSLFIKNTPENYTNHWQWELNIMAVISTWNCYVKLAPRSTAVDFLHFLNWISSIETWIFILTNKERKNMPWARFRNGFKLRLEGMIERGMLIFSDETILARISAGISKFIWKAFILKIIEFIWSNWKTPSAKKINFESSLNQFQRKNTPEVVYKWSLAHTNAMAISSYIRHAYAGSGRR